MNIVNRKILFSFNSLLTAYVITFQQLVHAHLIYIKEMTILTIVTLARIDCNNRSPKCEARYTK